MNVLYISHEADLNGAPKSLLEFLGGIEEKGIRPIVVIPNRGKLKAELARQKIDTRIVAYDRCVYHKRRDVLGYVNYYAKNLEAVKKLVKVIREEKIDIVHSNSLAVDVGALAAYLTRVPHVWHCREYLKEDFGFQITNPLLDRWLIKRSACCIAISTGIEKKLIEKYGIHPIRVYNGLDKESYYLPVMRAQDSVGRTKLLIAGRVSEGKGQWDAVRAVEILVKRGIAVHLSVVGDGDQYDLNKIKKYVKQHTMEDHITFMPYNKNLQEIRLESDIILVCSKMEAFGRVTAEAMMAGKIVIGADAGGTAELIGAHEERGYLYTRSNVKELADQIEYVIEHPDEMYEKEKRAQDFILKLTDLDSYTDKIKGIYQQIVSR